MTASPVLEYNKSILTSVVAIAVGDFTAIFVGTGNGDLLKVSCFIFICNVLFLYVICLFL